jgi:hypothetical protein
MAVWAAIRSVIIFTLGIALIVGAAFGRPTLDRIIELIAGLILIGVLPVNVLLDRIGKPK